LNEFCIGWVITVEFQPSACRYPVFPVPFVEEAIFSELYVLGSFVKNHMALCSICLFLCLLFFSIDLCYCCIVTVFVTMSPEYNLKSSIMIPPAWLFVFLPLRVFYVFICVLRLILLFCRDWHRDFDQNCIEGVDCF
jgi:hypothetical protein